MEASEDNASSVVCRVSFRGRAGEDLGGHGGL